MQIFTVRCNTLVYIWLEFGTDTNTTAKFSAIVLATPDCGTPPGKRDCDARDCSSPRGVIWYGWQLVQFARGRGS